MQDNQFKRLPVVFFIALKSDGCGKYSNTEVNYVILV